MVLYEQRGAPNQPPDHLKIIAHPYVILVYVGIIEIFIGMRFHPLKNKIVLIVEDTVELAEVIEATLQNMGLKTFHETHGAKALTMFKDKKPDLVLLDIGLPDMLGWKVLESLKEMKKAGRPKIVIITAYADAANRVMGKLQDVDEYLIKPFSPDEVERVVTRVLNG